MSERQVHISSLDPVDRVHWGPIVAGMFVALAILVWTSILARAVGFGFSPIQGRTANYETGAIIWGTVAAFIAFGIGAFLAAQWAGLRGSGRSMLHGFLVWAVGVTVLIYGLGTTIGPMLGTTSPETTGAGVIHAVQTPGATDIPAVPPGRISPAAWWMLLSITAGLLAALVGGALGSRRYGTTYSERRVVSE